MALDGLKFVIEEDATPRTKIRVFGVGGGGSNAVARMMNEGVKGVEFCVLNTDAQALASCPVPTKLTIGAKITHGLGAGSDPAVGRQAALEDTERIIDLLEGADMVFVTAGLGGGTGTGAAPVVASLAKELGALTVAVVTKPFSFEGPRRSRMADQGLAELAGVVDTVITVPNDQLLSLVPKGTSFFEAFRAADDVLRQAVQGISDIINTPGLINRDFSDVRSIMAGMGYAMLGTASAKGENACVEAARRAISSPMMEAGGVRGARGVLINIAGSSALGLHEVNEACTLVREATANDDVQINFGVVLDEGMGDEVKITVIATGFVRENLPRIERRGDRVEAAAAAAGPPAPARPAPAQQLPGPQIEKEPEPAYASAPKQFEEPGMPVAAAPAAACFEEDPEPAAMAAPANGAPQIPEPMDDLEVPAILRARRRMVQ
jgi:cell division protein FtsZ